MCICTYNFRPLLVTSRDSSSLFCPPLNDLFTAGLAREYEDGANEAQHVKPDQLRPAGPVDAEAGEHCLGELQAE